MRLGHLVHITEYNILFNIECVLKEEARRLRSGLTYTLWAINTFYGVLMASSSMLLTIGPRTKRGLKRLELICSRNYV